MWPDMKSWLITIWVWVALVVPAHGQRLVGWWRFNEASGSSATDSSGLGNHGTISGAVRTSTGDIKAALFDGINDDVNCGSSSSLSPSSAVTVRVWIYPETRPTGERGVVINNSLNSYGLTYFQDARCWWYIAGGGNNVKAGVPVGHWSQVSCTYDGAEMRIYVNGALIDSRSLGVAIPSGGGPLYIANRPVTGQRFRGLLDEVQVYSRALSASEVAALYAQEANTVLSRRPALTGSPVLVAASFTARVGNRGGIQVEVGGDRYHLDTGFSYPGSVVGMNYFSQSDFGSGPGWSPVVSQSGTNTINVSAGGSSYTVQRQVLLESDRFRIRDTVTNITASDVAVLIGNTVIAENGFTELHPAAEGASVENPMALLVRPGSSLAAVVEDAIGRLHFERSSSQNQALFGSRFFALKAGGTHTFEWLVYPSGPASGYFQQVRQLREDWNANVPILGPTGFLDINFPGLLNPAAMTNYLSWKKLKVVIMIPWLDYDPGSLPYIPDRNEFRQMMQAAMASLKQADPDILVLGAVETDWVAFDPDEIPGGHLLPSYSGGGSGNVELTPAQTAIIDNAQLPWQDSYKRTASGNLVMELYSRGGAPQQALSVYPEVGNYQYQFLLDQIRFIMDDVGMDGFYIDEFSQAWSGPLRTYNTRWNGQTWDGFSADIDSSTGQIARRFTDASLVGVQARLNLMQEAHTRGKVVIANTNASSLAEHAVSASRFQELFNRFDPMDWPLGTKPPLFPYFLRGHLNTPIAYGIAPDPELQDHAERLVKGVITYLRHGLVYYHAVLPDPPQAGPGSGGFGPVNHMFPITPVESGEGFIKGPERIITCVSGVHERPQGPRPDILIFDSVGKPINHAMVAQPAGLGWTVNLQIINWAQVAVIAVDESKPAPDFDRSGEVDSTDLAHFLACMTGRDIGPPSQGCGDTDIDLDGDADLDDFAVLQRCFSGALTPADPACDD